MTHTRCLYRGYYAVAGRYQFYIRVARTRSRKMFGNVHLALGTILENLWKVVRITR